METLIEEKDVELSANGSDTLSFSVNEGKKFTITKITFDSDGSFKITDVRNTATGDRLLCGALPSALMRNHANVNLTVLDSPVELEGPTKLVFDITDTSGSTNKVNICLYGRVEYG